MPRQPAGQAALVLYLAVQAAWAYTTWAVTLVPASAPGAASRWSC
ncbi:MULTISPECIES: hypothetical protein [unclassified Streptomyces]|nr:MULTISPECIES: hypothetical protein [unclassified Streptomyces]